VSPVLAAAAFDAGWGTALIVAVLVFAGGGLVTAVFTRRADAVSKRRDAYAGATEALVRWIEYPYRVRRRTSDDVETLDRLASLGHDLQEQLACHQTWVTTECAWVGDIYKQVLDGIRTPCKAALKEAWDAEPVTAGGGMNLNGFGPGDLDAWVQVMNTAVGYRFGLGRIWWWKPGKVTRSLTEAASASNET
jgi:hypothetical protein